MAKKERKRDELVVMRLITQGKNKAKDLTDSLDWSRDRVEETVDKLREHDYVKQVSDGGDQVLKVTEDGVKEVPRMARDVADDTREFVDAVLNDFQKHFNKVFPKITIDVNVEKEDDK